MSSDQTAHAAEATDEKAHKEKSATLHLIPNSNTLHVVKTIPEDETDHDDAEGKKKGSTFHRLPNSETLHVVK